MYNGTVTFKKLVKSATGIMKALSNGVVELPENADGEAFLYIDGEGESAALTLDLQEAPIFTLNNVAWNFVNASSVTQKRVEIRNGAIFIYVTGTII